MWGALCFVFQIAPTIGDSGMRSTPQTNLLGEVSCTHSNGKLLLWRSCGPSQLSSHKQQSHGLHFPSLHFGLEFFYCKVLSNRYLLLYSSLPFSCGLHSRNSYFDLKTSAIVPQLPVKLGNVPDFPGNVH